MNRFNLSRHAPPLNTATLLIAILSLLLLAACAPPPVAHAAEPEPGIVYVQHRFTDDSGTHEAGPYRAYATYTADKQAYSARINASGGAVDVEGRWKAHADGVDITEECSYDAKSGLVKIPRSHLNSPVAITVDLDAEQSEAAFELNVTTVAGNGPGQWGTERTTVAARDTSLSLPVPSPVKAVTQDSRVLDESEYRCSEGVLTIEGRSALAGSITIYLETYAPDVANRNPIKDYNDTLLKRSLQTAPLNFSPTPFSVAGGGSFSGSGWIYSTNPGWGDWDYTDYVLEWWGGTFYLNCCEHGVLRMPEALAGGGTKAFTATHTGSSVVRSYDTIDDTTIYHHTVYRDDYYVYVDAGRYQDVDGTWSEEREVVTSSPRYGGIDLTKESADPSITDGNGSYSLAGAEYGIFSDPQCSNRIGSMTTDGNGKASAGGLRAGSTVYVKETCSSPGYDLDPNVYAVAIVADQYAHVNGGIVYEPPKTATVRFYVDGSDSPVHAATFPLGTNLTEDDPEVKTASELAEKPDCTPGLDAWYRDSGCSSKFEGLTLRGDLNLYARNIATVTYSPAAGSPLAQKLPIRKEMSESAPLLDVRKDVLPPSRQVSWGRKIALKDPLLETLFYDDGERWRTLRWRGGGWYLNAAATGSPESTLEVLRDTTVYCDWTRSTYDGIYSW